MKNSAPKSDIKPMLLFLIVFVFPVLALYVPQQAARAKPTDFYIDSVGGNDANDGLTPSTAWQSHTKVGTVSLQPGDSVRFKRGSQFSGPIVISESGTVANPILLTDYGQGSAPRFTNPNNLDMNGNCIRISGDYIIVENLYFHDTPPTGNWRRLPSVFPMGAIFNMPGADHNIIRNNVFWNCTKGIQSTGEFTLITNNYLDGPSHALWYAPGAGGGWGPMGIMLGIGNQEVSYNTIKNYLTEESPYGTDGGAIIFEDGRFHKDNLYAHHNFTEGNGGFFESSWALDVNPYVQEVHNLRVAFNVSNDGQCYIYMHAPTHNTYFDNNTIIRANDYPNPYPDFEEIIYAAFDGITFRNNLIVGSPNVINHSPYSPYWGDITVENDWYWEVGSTSYGDGDPLLVDFNDGDYHLTASSPLIGQAQNLSQHYSTDFDGVLLPSSGPWDIGAYMFVVEATCNLPGNLNDDYRVDLLDFAELGAGWQDPYDMNDLKEMAADWLIYCNIGPYVMITNPANGDNFDEGQMITITADACDVDGSIIKVEFFDYSFKLGEDLTEPYSFGWMNATVGQHSLRARATDNENKTTTSAAVNITVSGMPYVVITSPSNGDSFGEGEVITITADAWDDYGSIIKVEFFDGDNKLGEDTTEPYSFGWAGATVGQHSLKAKATDNDNNTTTSAAVIITVIAPIPPPVPGKWRSFDVVMNPAGSPQADVTDGNDVTAEIEFYESANDNGVVMGSLFDVYDEGEHATGFNRAEHIWAFKTGWDAYPYAAKSTVGRGAGSGEGPFGNVPTPLGVFDLQLYPPENNHLTVAAFIVPEAGSYSVYDLAVRRVRSAGDLAGYRVFDSDKNLLTHIVASTNQDWVTDSTTYNLDSLQAGDRIYFAADREDAHYYSDATEIIWTIEKN